jgi:hypothetical protein
MRDVRLAQARIVTAEEFLTPAGSRPGDGKVLDVDQELFTGLNIADDKEMGSDPFKLIQPDIRAVQLAAVIVDQVRTIVSGAGFSPQTFGIDIQGQAESGTALRVREKKTLHTTNRKRGYWRVAVEEHAENLLALNAALFGGPPPMRPRLDWPDLADDPAERAQTTSIWRGAQAMSIREAVRERNPHWDEEQVDEEVALIEDETAAKMPAMDLTPPEEGGQQEGGSVQP